MRRILMGFTVLLAVIGLLVPAGAMAQDGIQTQVFNVGEASGVAVDADGMVWFTQRVNLKIGKLDPSTGEYTLYPIPYQTGARYGGGGNPETIIVDSNGDIWFTEIPMMDGGGPAKVARFHPDTETFDEYLINANWWNGYGGSIALTPMGLFQDASGRIWFNDRAGHPHIGNLNPETGELTIYPVEPSSVSGGSGDVVVLEDGNIYYSNSWSERGLWGFDEATGEATRIASGAFDLNPDSDGNIWFTSWYTPGYYGKIGQLAPNGDVIYHSYQEGGYGGSKFLDVDLSGNVWFTAGGTVYRFDPSTSTFKGFYINGISDPWDIDVDKWNRVWVASWDKIGLLITNQPPVADAGPDQTVECASHSGSAVTLDGSGSSDSEGNELTYAWTWGGGSAEGASTTGTFPLGTTEVTLTVTDMSGLSSTDTVNITVEDTVPPELSVIIDPAILWPANHKLVPVDPSITAVDTCDALIEVKLINVTSNEATNGTGDGNTDQDIVISGSGIRLRAERSGEGDGRTYAITYSATDGSGNSATASGEVLVPHDRGK